MEHILEKLKIPSIGLIIGAILNAATGLILLISGIVRFASTKEVFPTDEAERIGYMVATYGGYGLATVSLILSPLTLIGGIKMMKGKNRGLAIIGAIVATLPFTSCCFWISAIFGIWALVVLVQSDVKSFFAAGGEDSLVASGRGR